MILEELNNHLDLKKNNVNNCANLQFGNISFHAKKLVLVQTNRSTFLALKKALNYSFVESV